MCFSDQVPLRKVLQAAKHHLRHSSGNSEKQQWCNWQKNKESNATTGNRTAGALACSYVWGRDKGEFSLVETWGWQCSDWGTWCFVPMKNTILYSGQSFRHQWERTVTIDSVYSEIPVRTSKSLFSLD